MRPVRILQEDAEEAVAAAEWYEREHPGLGTEFSDPIEAAIDLLEEDILPLSTLPGKSGGKGAKRLILKRFPYDLVLRCAPNDMNRCKFPVMATQNNQIVTGVPFQARP